MKKTISVALVIAVLFSLAVPAYAVTTPTEDFENVRVIVDGNDITVDTKEEIQRAISGITDIEESAPVEVSIPLSVDDNTSVETYTTTRAIHLPTSTRSSMSAKNDEASTVFATTSVAVLRSGEKTSTDSKNQSYVTAYATIYWRDKVGMANEFISASGGWDRDVNPSTGVKPTLSNRKVQLRAYFDASHDEIKNYSVSTDTWQYGSSALPYSGWIFMVTMSVKINNSSTPFTFTMKTSATD